MARVFKASSFRLAACGALATVAFAVPSVPLRAEPSDKVSEGSRAPSTTRIDLSDPVFSITLDGDRGYVLGSWVYAAGWGFFYGSALSIYDFAGTNPAAPLGTMHLWSGPRTFAVQGGLGYFAGYYNFSIVDLSDPANIHEFGSISGLPDGEEGCVAVAGWLAYVGDGAGIHVVDVSNPDSPSRLGTVALPAKAVSVALSGSLACVGMLDARMALLDVTDPMAPAVVATVPLPGTPWDIEIRGSHAYVADGEAGLQVLDVSRPAESRIVGGVDTPGDAHDVAVAGARAYLADGSELRVIDISKPTRPAIANSISKDVATVSVSQGRFAVGGTFIRTDVECLAGFGPPCNVYGFLEVGRTSAYEPTARGVSNARDFGSRGLRSASPPAQFALTRSAPNPFNPETTIHFDVPWASRVTIRVYDSRGTLVRTLVDDMVPSGRHEVAWRGRNEHDAAVASGAYFITMEAEGVRQTMKVTLLK